MRRLATRILVLLVLLWGIWWWIAGTGMQRGITGWFDAQRANGTLATFENMSRGGAPFSIATTVNGVSLSDPEQGTSITLPPVTLSTPIHWPGDATLRLPAQPVRIETPQGAATLTSGGAEAAVHLHPGTTLQLEALHGSSTNLSLDTADGQLLSITSVQADVQQGDLPTQYDIDLTATGLTLGAASKEGLALPASWPDTFEPIIADMTVTFDRTWDRAALHGQRPQPRLIQIDQIQALYADTGFTIGGDLTVDTNGVPSGKLRLLVRNWNRVFDMAVAASDIPPEWSPTVQRVLASIADADGTLDLDLVIERGQMRIGFLPLGPAPRLIIR